MRSERGLRTGLLAGAVLPFVLTGCAGTSGAAPAAVPDGSSAPLMSGPWADEFANEWETASTPFERSALEDGVVSEQEYAEMTELFRDCLSSEGITFEGFTPDGSYSTSTSPSRDPDEANDAVDACSRSTGEDSVGLLYSWVNRNPQRLDDNSIVVDCLHDVGAVDRSYTAHDYADDIESESYPFIIDNDAGLDAVQLCESDPLGLLGIRP